MKDEPPDCVWPEKHPDNYSMVEESADYIAVSSLLDFSWIEDQPTDYPDTLQQSFENCSMVEHPSVYSIAGKQPSDYLSTCNQLKQRRHLHPDLILI